MVEMGDLRMTSLATKLKPAPKCVFRKTVEFLTPKCRKMKRFIDLHGQIFGYDVGEDGQDESDNLFCFYDTVTGKFEEFSGDQVFSSEDDFKMSYEGVQLERYLKLIPDKYKNK